MPMLPKPVTQIAALALLVVVLATVVTLMIEPFVAYRTALLDSIVTQRSIAGRLASALHAIRQGGDDSNQSDSKSKLFVNGDTAPIRLSALQSDISTILSQHNVKPRLLRLLPSRERNSLHLIGAEIEMQTSLEVALHIILAIERHEPALFLEAIHITPATDSVSPADELNGEINLRATITAAEWREESN